METTALAATERAALIALLDDPSPAVRRALRARFTALGERAGLMLREVAAGGDRQLARHALEYLEELGLSDPAAEFRAYIRGRRYELEAGSLLLARIANPRLDEAACRSQLDAMAARCRAMITEPSSTREKCRALNRVLFHECGFHGNTENYTDPRNSFLDQVLERRTGLPISLSIVYLLVAARAGLELEPVGLPGHFLVGCFSDGLPFFIDAFGAGSSAARPTCSTRWPRAPAASGPRTSRRPASPRSSAAAAATLHATTRPRSIRKGRGCSRVSWGSSRPRTPASRRKARGVDPLTTRGAHPSLGSE